MNVENIPAFKELNDELNNIKNIIIHEETMLCERIVNYLNRNIARSENFSFTAFENKSSKTINCGREFFQFAIAINRIPESVKKSHYRLENNTSVYFLDLNLDVQKHTFNIEHRFNNDIWHNFLEFNTEVFEFEKSIFKINETVYTNLEALKDIISEIFTDEYFEAKSQLSLKNSKVRDFTDMLDTYIGRNTFNCVENTIVSEMSNSGIIVKDAAYGHHCVRFKYTNNGLKNTNRRSYLFNNSDDVKHSVMYRNRNILKKN